MRDFLRPILRHFIAAAVGAGAAVVTVKTGVDLGPETTEPIIAAATIGVYGAVNHGLKALGGLIRRRK